MGRYPELSLRDARAMLDEARRQIAKGPNPRIARKQKQQATRLAGEYTFMTVYEQWLSYRTLALSEGQQSTLAQIRRVFKKDVIPVLRRMTIYEITRHHLLEVIGYPRVWVDAQLSHADPNRISAIYNHAQYVEQRRVMMQDWANRLDLLEQGEVAAASRHLIVHLQGVAEMAWWGDRTLQRSGVYASYPMEVCWQQTMQDPTKNMNARIATHMGSDITVSL